MAFKPRGDKILFVTAGLLTIFGLLMVYSASSVLASSEHGMSFYVFLKQFIYAALGFWCLVRLMHIDYHKWMDRRIIYTALIASGLALVIVLTQPAINGAQRWIRFAGLSFQPSEMAKLTVILFTAAFLNEHEDKINRPTRHLLTLVLIIVFFAAIIYVEPDLGQALCIAFIAAVMLFVAGLPWKYYASVIVLAIPCFYFFVFRVDYRWGRIMAFLNPFEDPQKTGYHIIQSLTALGSGGLTGLGLGASKQKLFFLPEASSDFIFAIIGEELGLLGTCAVTCGFLIYFFRGMKIALRSPDRFGFYLALGITLMVVLQGFINISVALSLVPTKGIALPFISQGGTSLFFTLLATGILLNLSYRNQLETAD